MALTAATTRSRRETGDIAQRGVAANAVIYQGGLVCYNSAGFLVPAADVAGYSTCAGVALEDADNTGGANGAITCRLRSAVYVFTDSAAVRAIAVTDRQAVCYATDDDNVQISGTGNMPIAGIIEDVDASGVWVRVDASRVAAATDAAIAEGGPVFNVRGASTANVAALATFTVANDGITLVEGERVLLKDQAAGAENGIYVVGTVAAGSAPLTRALDADGNDEIVPNMVVVVAEGTAGADTAWQLTTNAPITVDTTALVFAQTLFSYGAAGAMTALTAGGTAAAGTSALAARIDHKHATASAAPTGATLVQAAAEGVADTFARADHAHVGASAAPTGATLVQAAAEGTDTTYARTDHAHVGASAVPTGAILVQAAAEGTDTTYARTDHAHVGASAAPGAIAIGDAAAEGAAATYARSDHTHAVTAAVAPEDVDSTAAAAGVSTDFAAADHKHDILATSGLIVQNRSVQFTSADLTQAGLVQTINLGAAIPANARLLSWDYNLVDAFDSPGAGSLDVQLGDTVTDDDSICSAFDAYTGSANEGVPGGGTEGVGSHGLNISGSQLAALFTATVDNLNTFTNGDLTITVTFAVLA